MKKQLTYLFAISLVCALAVERISSQYFLNSDTFWYLKFGEYMWVNKTIPDIELFSWSVLGKQVIYQEWLFQVLLYLSSTFGVVGIKVFCGIIVLLALFTLFMLTRKTSLVQRALTISAAALNLVPGLVARAQLIDFPSWGFFLYAVSTGRYLWALPLLTILWANLHASVIIAALTVWGAAIFPKINIGRFEYAPKNRKKLIITAALVTLATLATPHGIDTWSYAIRAITDSDIRQYMVEWGPARLYAPLYRAIILLTLTAFSWKLVGQDKLNPYLLLIFIVSFASALAQLRYFPYAGLALAAFVGLPGVKLKEKISKSLVTAVAIGSVMLQIFIVGTGPKTFLQYFNSQDYPVGAVQYIKDNQVEKVLNWHNWGGYLIYEGVPTFIDGRSEVFNWESDVFKDYMKRYSKLEIETVADKYGAKAILVPVDSLIDKHVRLKPGNWTEKYRDDAAVIYTRQ